MPVNNRIEPGVYVTIEDASYISPPVEVGRTVFMVGFCDRGPHNQVVEVTSQEAFQRKFGPPNFKRTSQSHYNFDHAMQYTGRGLYIRVTPYDSKPASVSIEENLLTTDILSKDGNNTGFTFTSPPDPEALDFSTEYRVSVPIEGSEEFISPITGEYDPSEYDDALAKYESYMRAVEAAKYVNTVINEVDADIFDSLSIGDWIYAGPTSDGQIPEDDETSLRQIVNKEWDSDINSGVYTLDLPYEGEFTTSQTTKNVSIVKHDQYAINSPELSWDTTIDNIDVEDEVLFKFFSTGTGEYYNNYVIKGVRNTELEKMYTSDDGDILYKYLFMNIGVYETKEDGNMKLVEGPWITSLTRTNPDGIVIRDLAFGEILFIEEVINNNSEIIRCKAGTGSAIQPLLNKFDDGTGTIVRDPIRGEKARLRAMLQLSREGKIVGSQVSSREDGIKLSNGSDGHSNYPIGDTSDWGTTNAIEMYKYDTLQLHPILHGMAELAYNGSLTSVDGSIEQLREVTYPWYLPDYIVTAGFPAHVQDAGRQLADYRQDVFHIGDTGYQRRYTDDLNARLNHVPWNNWTSMLYVQYRRINDAYTGEKVMMNPGYHAIARHLAIDAQYFIGEPVANIEKGAISEPIELAYRANHVERGDLISAELNPTIVEPQGKYFLSQYTTWKRLSILKQAHAAKFVCYARKMIPPLLKDILNRKATPYWINQARQRVEKFLNQFKNSSVERYKILNAYSVNVQFDEMASELNVYINMTPIRSIERINVFIIVE